MKIARKSICLLVAMIIMGSLTCMVNADSFEPDNSSSNAASITTDGQAQSHSINPAADEDWLVFTIESISDVVIETSGISGDTVMWLYNGQFVELATDDDGGAESFSRIQTTLPTGTYYVRIKEFNVKAVISEYFVSVLATPRKVSSIYPNSATKGDSLEVTIKGLGTTFFQGSSTITNVWLSKGSTTIDANSFIGIDTTTIEASFDIPVNAVAGKWDVHVSNSVDGNLPSFVDGFLVYIYPDLNEDGKVDNTDFALLANHWLELTVPNVIGMTRSEAQTAFESVSLVVGTITYDYHAAIPSGNVISCEPVAGTKVSGGTAVNLIVSDGVVYDVVWVSINEPNFVGEMSKYETTNAQYCQFLNDAKALNQITVYTDNVVYATSDTSHSHPYYNLDGDGHTYNNATNGGAARINWTGSSFTVDSGFENHPVTFVSWYGSMAFCDSYGYRLPTEWEWRAVADYDGTYKYGCGVNISNSTANYYNSSHLNGTTVVGAFGSYGYGLCDMAGNVMEWTSSDYMDFFRVIGGGWNDLDDYCIVSFKSGNGQQFMWFSFGFRVCR